jgi:outer membrane protein insertion porin family
LRIALPLAVSLGAMAPAGWAQETQQGATQQGATQQGATQGAQPTAKPEIQKQAPTTNEPPKQTPPKPRVPLADQPPAAGQPEPGKSKATAALNDYAGQTVVAIEFRGVDEKRLTTLGNNLPQRVGQPLDPAKVRASLRRLYTTGLYNTMELEGEPVTGGVKLIFTGEPRAFVGRVTIVGVKNDRLSSQLQRAAKLNLGEGYSRERAEKGSNLVEDSLRSNGYHRAAVKLEEGFDDNRGLMNVTYVIDLGEQARVGSVDVKGDAGITEKKFRKVAKLKPRSKVTLNTTRNALHNLREQYQKENRLEAKVALNKEDFQPPSNQIDYGFNVDRGPVVVIQVNGARVGKGKLQTLVPVFQEGSVDEDLLNEGSRNLRNHYQERGFFDAQVTHDAPTPASGKETILYTVKLGQRHKVLSVRFAGNKYFDSATIRERLQVLPADILLRYGRYSTGLISNDTDSITALYQSNGFRDVKVTAEITDEGAQLGFTGKLAGIRVVYKIEEGPQSKIGKVEVTGVEKVPLADIKKLMNTQSAQPYSVANLAGDRDTMVTTYLAGGFANAQVEVAQVPEKDDPQVVNITFKVTEGQQVFINSVYVMGLHYTRPSVVNGQMQVKAGEPLNQTALIETQRRLYDLALFNEVDVATEDPNGDLPSKDILLNLTEAKRWDLAYGFGIQAQTGNPNTSCPSVATLIQLGIDPSTYHCSPQGKTGASALVSFDATRINFRGRDETITLHTLYGSLEQAATLIFAAPHWRGYRNLALSISGGYTSNQDVTTFAASTLEGDVQLTQILRRGGNQRPVDTLIYRFSYRRVSVNPQSIQVAADEIPLLSQPARVGGPGGTFIRDTRDDPLNAHRGNFLTVQAFLSSSIFASQADFARFDATQASYHAFGKRRWIIARSTRYGAEVVYGGLGYRTIPLPERLFAGGATSHRGFAINQAGPRDTQTGYPLGGAGAFVNSIELRTPTTQLPLVGNNLSFVLFHDMGNVFQTPAAAFNSAFRWHQPNRGTCSNLAVTGGLCDFNYFSHAVGLGLRYATPIGPIRVDLSDNLNPPVYPILVDPIRGPHVGELSHFNFFFSLGQSF